MKPGRKIAVTLAAALFTGSLLFGQASLSPEVQFKAAQNKEQVEGDVKGAIEEYKKLAQGKDRAIAAKALVRMGECYEKLRLGDATAAYERVLREFSDQAESVTTARTRLAALAGAPASLAQRLVATLDTRDLIRSVSSDGRVLAVINNHGDLVLRDTSTGKANSIATGTCAGRLASDCTYAWSTILSGDLRQIAYNWWDLASKTLELRLIANQADAQPRTLVLNSQFRVIPTDWSLNGKSILGIFRRPNSADQIGWVSVSDGSSKAIKTVASVWSNPKLSPDGKFIVYSAASVNPNNPSTQADENVDIHVLAADGSSDTRLTTAGINESPLWAQDGAHILFISNRSGTFALWSIAVRDGKAESDPAPVKKDTGRISPIGITRSGSYYFVQEGTIGVLGRTNVFEAEVDPDTGKPRSPRKYLSEYFVGQNCCPIWSPDGKSVAFKRQRPQDLDIRDVVVRSIESGQEKTYTAPDWTNTRYGFGPGNPTWLHDGTGFLIGKEPIQGQSRWIGKMDLKGQFTKLVQIGPELGWAADLSPDDKTVYVLSRKDNSPNGAYTGIVAVNLATGEQRRVFTANGIVGASAVTNGAGALAFFVFPEGTNDLRLATIEADGTGYRELYSTARGNAAASIGPEWANGGHALFFSVAGRVMRLALPNGVPEITGLQMSGPDFAFPISLRADGSRIVFSDGNTTNVTRELWALDNVSSVLK